MDKNKFALNDDVMEEISGGEMGLVTFYDYECKSCMNVVMLLALLTVMNCVFAAM